MYWKFDNNYASGAFITWSTSIVWYSYSLIDNPNMSFQKNSLKDAMSTCIPHVCFVWLVIHLIANRGRQLSVETFKCNFLIIWICCVIKFINKTQMKVRIKIKCNYKLPLYLKYILYIYTLIYFHIDWAKTIDWSENFRLLYF